jgi:hypothetical protein
VNLVTQQNPLPIDDHGHGSTIASMIHDVAPDATIISIKIANQQGQSDLWLLEAGLFAAVDKKAHVTNISMAYGLAPAPCPNCGYGHSLSADTSGRTLLIAPSNTRQRTGLWWPPPVTTDGQQKISHPSACRELREFYRKRRFQFR